MLNGLNWKKLLLNLSIWLTAEIILTALGLDNLADYGEFIIQSNGAAFTNDAVAALTAVV